jgi:pyrroline-5-carboxylate reductase
MASVASIGFIGGGNMAEAIIKGLVRGTFPAEGILVAELEERRRTLLAERYGVRTTAELNEVVRTCEVVVLAVKPQAVAEVLPGVAAHFSGDQLLVSILAGVSTATIEAHFDGSPRVVRVMPNTPALVGKGMSVAVPGAQATANDLKQTLKLFKAVGEAVAITGEDLLDSVTALSGSGPAFVYFFAECLTEGGVRGGLSQQLATQLAHQTLVGAAAMLLESGMSARELREMVTSPGGTTMAGLQALEDNQFRRVVISALDAATRRARELAAA